MSCVEANKSRSVSSAAVSGVFQALAGLVGAGGFWQPTDSSELKDLTADFDSLKELWTKKIDSDVNILTQAQHKFANEQTQLMISTQNFKNEVLDDKINTNTLLIQITMVIVFIIIIYLIVL